MRFRSATNHLEPRLRHHEMIADPDLAYLRLAVRDLDDYLLSPELFWALPSSPTSLGEPGLQQLTLGGVALSLARASAAGATGLEPLREVVDRVRTKWRATWAKKAAREYQSRLELWQRTLADLLEESAGRKAAYPSRVRVRTIFDLLLAEMAPETPTDPQRLISLDARLRAVAREGPFVWEGCFEPGFPKERFWYLYIQFN